MIHVKVIKAIYLKRALMVIVIIIATMVLLKNLNLNWKSIKFSKDSKSNADFHIYDIIVNKTIPLLDVTMDNNSELTGISAYDIFKSITKIDFKNPRTYLTSEIPLLGMIEVATFNGRVDGILSSDKVSEGKIADVKSSNFEDKVVENSNLDYTKPAVIIYHTHATESFLPTEKNNYKMEGDYRTTDNNYNTCKIGDEIKNYIEKYYGFAVIHDTTAHDSPDYNGSYLRSRPTAEKLLKKYPDVKLIIDVHRDAFSDTEAARKKMVVNIREEQAAKIMFVIGKSNPHWQENYQLALKLNQKIEELYPGLSRNILVRDNIIYNQDISNKSMIIEIGSDCNTLEETLVSAKMVARSIGQILK